MFVKLQGLFVSFHHSVIPLLQEHVLRHHLLLFSLMAPNPFSPFVVLRLLHLIPSLFVKHLLLHLPLLCWFVRRFLHLFLDLFLHLLLRQLLRPSNRHHLGGVKAEACGSKVSENLLVNI